MRLLVGGCSGEHQDRRLDVDEGDGRRDRLNLLQTGDLDEQDGADVRLEQRIAVVREAMLAEQLSVVREEERRGPVLVLPLVERLEQPPDLVVAIVDGAVVVVRERVAVLPARVLPVRVVGAAVVEEEEVRLRPVLGRGGEVLERGVGGLLGGVLVRRLPVVDRPWRLPDAEPLADVLDVLETEADGRDPSVAGGDPAMPPFTPASPWALRLQKTTGSTPATAGQTYHPFVPWG